MLKIYCYKKLQLYRVITAGIVTVFEEVLLTKVLEGKTEDGGGVQEKRFSVSRCTISMVDQILGLTQLHNYIVPCIGTCMRHLDVSQDDLSYSNSFHTAHTQSAKSRPIAMSAVENKQTGE